jgi:hypothetical protein
MSDNWHPAFESASGGASGSGLASASDDPAESGLFGAEADEFAFLRDEEALPVRREAECASWEV